MKSSTRIQICAGLLLVILWQLESVAGQGTQVYSKEFCADINFQNGFVTNSQRSRAKTNLDQIRTLTKRKNSIQEFYDTDDKMKLAMAQIPIAAPWAAFIVILLFLWFFFSLCCVCDCICPPSKCCRRNLEKDPYTQCNKCFPFFLLMFSGVGLLVAGIYGSVAVSNIKTGYDKMSCATLKFAESVNQGELSYYYYVHNALEDKTNRWNGLISISDKLTELSQDVQNFLDKISEFVNTNAGWSSNISEQMYASVKEMDEGQVNSKDYWFYLDSVDQAADFKGIFSDADSQYVQLQLQQSVFFRQVWKSILQKLKEQIDSQFKNLADQQVELLNVAKDIKNYGATMKSSIDSGNTNVKDIIQSVNNMIKDFNTYVKDGGQYVDYIDYGKIYYLIGGLFGVLFIISGLGIYSCKWTCCRCCLNLEWCFAILFSLIVFVTILVLFPVSIIGMESCEILDGMLNDKIKFNAYPKIMKADITGKIETCLPSLNGTGDILSKFDMYEKIQDLRTVATTMNQSLTFDNSVIDLFQTSLANLQVNLTNIRDYFDSQADTEKQQTDSLYYAYVLKMINRITDQATSPDWIRYPSDAFEGHINSKIDAIADQCNYQIQFLSNDKIKKRTTEITSPYTVTNNAFIDIDKFTSASKPSFCPALDATIDKTVQIVERKNAIVNQKYNDITSFSSIFNQIKDRQNKIKSLSNEIGAYIDNVMDPKTGLLNVNCQFVGNSLNEIYDTVCVSTVQSIYTVSVLTILMGLSLFVGIIVAFRLAQIYTNQVKFDAKKKKEETYKEVNQDPN